MTDSTGARIRKWRRGVADLTQAQLAERCGVSAQTVAGWEKGQTPEAVALVRLADEMGVHPRELLEQDTDAPAVTVDKAG